MFYEVLLKITVLLFKVTIYLTNEAMPLLLLQLGRFARSSQEVQTQSLISYSLVEVKIAKLLGGVYTLSHLAETRLKRAKQEILSFTLLSLKMTHLEGSCLSLMWQT